MKPAAGRYILGGVGIVVVIAAVGAGLMILGSPAEERERRLDLKRVADLEEIGRSVDLYKTRRAALPADLIELVRQAGSTLSISDPNTHQLYEYRMLNPDQYELCAQFQQASTPPGSGLGDFWSHNAGRECFQLDAKRIDR